MGDSWEKAENLRVEVSSVRKRIRSVIEGSPVWGYDPEMKKIKHRFEIKLSIIEGSIERIRNHELKGSEIPGEYEKDLDALRDLKERLNKIDERNNRILDSNPNINEDMRNLNERIDKAMTWMKEHKVLTVLIVFAVGFCIFGSMFLLGYLLELIW